MLWIQLIFCFREKQA